MRLSYIDLIKGIENDETINIIGKIDLEAISIKNNDYLFYVFPLIERLILEIYLLHPESDVEDYEQGIMKTAISLMNSNADLDLIPEELVKIIRPYFEDDGIRNVIFHPIKESISFKVNYGELQYIIMHLLSILRKMAKANIEKRKIELD